MMMVPNLLPDIVEFFMQGTAEQTCQPLTGASPPDLADQQYELVVGQIR